MFTLKFEDFESFHVFFTIDTFTTREAAWAAAEVHRVTNRKHGKYHVFKIT